MAYSSAILQQANKKQTIDEMSRYSSLILVILASIQASIGGNLYGDTVTTIAAPGEYAYAARTPFSKFSAFPAPYIKSYAATPFGATYPGRYTTYNVAPYPASYAASPFGKFSGHLGLAAPSLGYAAGPYHGISAYSSPLLGHSDGSFSGVPFGGYRAHIGGYGSSHGGYAIPHAGYSAYAPHGHSYSPLSPW